MIGTEHDARALEANAASARLAFVCAYSSSEEYEADIIKARRAAGAYRPRRRQIRELAALVGMIAILLFGYLIAGW